MFNMGRNTKRQKMVKIKIFEGDKEE